MKVEIEKGKGSKYNSQDQGPENESDKNKREIQEAFEEEKKKNSNFILWSPRGKCNPK